jgi:ABC-type antimicrobial peptide transport system permease subunit
VLLLVGGAFGRVGDDREDSSEVVDVSLRSCETADRAQPQLQALPVMVEALPDSLASTLAIPYQSIVMLVIIAAGAGVLAALLPARRAGRLNVLDAISR